MGQARASRSTPGARDRPGDRRRAIPGGSRPSSRPGRRISQPLDGLGFRLARRCSRWPSSFALRSRSQTSRRACAGACSTPSETPRTCTRASSRRLPGATSGSRRTRSGGHGFWATRPTTRRWCSSRTPAARWPAWRSAGERGSSRISPSGRPTAAAGLGEGLLRAVFAEFARRGVARVRLKVDAGNPTGAVRLYRRAGMDELRRYAVYARRPSAVDRRGRRRGGDDDLAHPRRPSSIAPISIDAAAAAAAACPSSRS